MDSKALESIGFENLFDDIIVTEGVTESITFELIPLKSVGPLNTGDTRDMVRQKLGKYTKVKVKWTHKYKGKTYKSDDTGQEIQNSPDDFGFCRVYYNNKDIIKFVIFLPGYNTKLIYNNVDLFTLRGFEPEEYSMEMNKWYFDISTDRYGTGEIDYIRVPLMTSKEIYEEIKNR